MPFVVTKRDILYAVLGFILPPVAVAFRAGCGVDLLINLLLTLLGHVPGVLHAWYVILKLARERSEREGYRSINDLEAGHDHPPGGRCNSPVVILVATPEEARRLVPHSMPVSAAVSPQPQPTPQPQSAPEPKLQPPPHPSSAASAEAGPSHHDPPPAYTAEDTKSAAKKTDTA
ncbi:hypothetical protein THASP1DRAFT_29873 [Thamnocephalis sphaerospora]|uniref:Uncharacterized protein n=1 Tax=Thamnocephalis sphaerospora TaxID=78915 RepID=A0A4P9XSJ4_9FUNG|nr:hypothetical protein THASP1DRAFT_29873 [Thamnocephalis sphaerospora]|eukprot:RKP08320.1 hypothetical protein THASP1DRAFT_29873 [Thamnocephalis sphaerospora]